MSKTDTSSIDQTIDVLVRDERPRRPITPGLLIVGVLALSLMAGVLYLAKTRIDERNDAHIKRVIGRETMEVVLYVEAHRLDADALPDKVMSDGGDPPFFVFIEGNEDTLVLHDSRIEYYETTGDDYRLCLSGERGAWGLFDSADGTGKVQTGLAGRCPA